MWLYKQESEMERVFIKSILRYHNLQTCIEHFFALVADVTKKQGGHSYLRSRDRDHTLFWST
jgi:hypothetical protein